MKKKVELVKGTAFEIDPNKNYLICFDKHSVSMQDLEDLISKLPIGNASVAIMINGDPNTAVKVIAAPEEKE